MCPEKIETSEETFLQPNSRIDLIEKMSPKRILSICRGIAQQSMAIPKNNAYRIANRDNRMIDDNVETINRCHDEMEDNFESGNDYESIVKTNTEICELSRRLNRNNRLIKTTKITADEIKRREGKGHNITIIDCRK